MKQPILTTCLKTALTHQTFPVIALFCLMQTAFVQSAGAQAKAKKDSIVTTVKGINLKEMPEPSTLNFKQCMSMAKKLEDRGSIYNSIRYYQEALKKDPSQTYINQALAQLSLDLRDYHSANKYFKTLVELDADKHESPLAIYYLATTYKYLGEYEKARHIFAQFMELAKGKKELDDYSQRCLLEIQGCDLGIQMQNDKAFKKLRIVHLDSNINQPFTDYSPVLRDKNTLYFGAWTSDSTVLIGKSERHGSYSRIYVSKRQGDTWDKARLASGQVNTVNYHVGNCTFAQDGRTMFYTQCLEDENLHMICNIYRSTLGDTGWTAGNMLEASINDKTATNTEPALGKNELGEDVLFFASDRDKKKGMDLYCAKINGDGSLGKAKALDAPVNTIGNELSPFYDFETNTLYFSSDGLPGIGGLDIFRTHAVNGKWSAPENVGMPINSSADDMYYVSYENYGVGFVVSNRTGGYWTKSENWSDDIYELLPVKPIVAVKGKITTDDKTSAAVQDVVLTDAETGKTIKTIHTNDGTFFFPLETDKTYKVSTNKDGYFAAVQSISTLNTTKSDTFDYTLLLKKMEKNKAYSLNNIYYEFDKADLTKSSEGVLDTLFEILKENPKIVIELSSHTDGKGNDKYNMELSQRRAESCVNYLVKVKGVPKERIVAKGYGKTVPVAPNTNPDGSDNPGGRAKNRRTEFKIIGETKG